jgi:hypothetical protein
VGRLQVDLLDALRRKVTTIAVVLRMDEISFWAENRAIAIVDRSVLRSWLPLEWPDDLIQHGIDLARTNLGLTLSIDGGYTYLLDPVDVDTLRQVV